MSNNDIFRNALGQLKEKLSPETVVVLYGPRRTGKTFLLKKIAKDLIKKEEILFVNGEFFETQRWLSSQNPKLMKQYIGNANIFIVDEAQKVPNIGQNLKLLVDTYPKLKIIASGSASFDLAKQVGEPLTGRKKTVSLFPISVSEVIETYGREYYESLFEENLIFGFYPKLFSLKSRQEKKEYLEELTNAYLFKDILEMDGIRNSKKIKDLLRLLAFQIGKEVSLQELGSSLDLHKDTVFKYLDLLEKSFVIINIRGFSRNLRKEVNKTSRYYFYDNGIRNALINNFNDIGLRNDIGELWENFVIIERIKKQSYQSIYSNNYFWRTYDQKEIDWVEERDGKLYGYEIKWNDKKKVKEPKLWKETYDNAEFKVINKENYLEFVTDNNGGE